MPRGFHSPRVSSPRTYFSEVSSLHRSLADRVSGGDKRTLNSVLVLDKILLEPKNVRILEGGPASRVCMAIAKSIVNCTGSLHISTTTDQVSWRRMRWFDAVTRLRRAESCTLESQSASQDSAPEPSGLNSTTWSLRRGRVTTALDEESCIRPLASNSRTLPTRTFVNSCHGS